MSCFSSILFLLLSWWFSPPEPTSLSPTKHGFLQDYGFEQSESESSAQVLKLLRDGAYRIQETDSGYVNDTSEYNIYSRGDSVFIEEKSLFHGQPKASTRKEIYSRKGKLLYRGSENNDWSYVGSDGSWLEYKHIHHMKYNNWLDTIILLLKISNDKFGRPLESDEYDSHEEFMDYGKIFYKTHYSYRNNGKEIEELHYQRKLERRPMASMKQMKDSVAKIKFQKEFQLYKERKLFGPVEYLLKKRVLKKIDSSARTIVTETTNYHDDVTSYIDNWSYDSVIYDINWRSVKEFKKTRYMQIQEEKVNYIRDANGLLLSTKSVFDNEPEKTLEKWEYDKKGNCISHFRGDHLETWEYDKKGNISKFDAGYYKNTFKIYYK